MSIRLGIIGIGNMGSGHMKNILEGKCPDFEMAAVADINPARLEWAREVTEGKIATFDSGVKLLDNNTLLNKMRESNEAFTAMMQKVNAIIKFVVTGEKEEEHDGCTGSYSTCSGCGHHH